MVIYNRFAVRTVLSVGVAVGTMMGMVSPAIAKEVAKVNGTSITEKDLELSLSSLNETQRGTFMRDENTRRELLFNVIDREVLAQEGEKLKIDQEADFKLAMAAYRKELLMSQVLSKKIASKLTPKAVKEYYAAHKDQFSTDRVRVQHILLEDENEAKQVLALAKDPKADFQDLAEKRSKDPSAKNNRGEVGFIGQHQMVPDFSKAAFSTPVGEVTGPIHTTYGYHIIKVIDKKIGKPFEYGEVELQVTAALRQQLVRNYIDSLKAQSKIVVDSVAIEK